MSLAFLPWVHIYGMTCELHTFTVTGSARAIVPNRDLILECLMKAKPDVIVAVPALFNRVSASLFANRHVVISVVNLFL